MGIETRFRDELRNKPFESYDEYMDYIFACVDVRLSDYIENLMRKYAAGQGNYKNVMYPDIEIAHNLCKDRMIQFIQSENKSYETEDDEEENEILEDDEELMDLLNVFASAQVSQDETEEEETSSFGVEDMMSFIDARISITNINAVKLPFYELCKKLEFGHFSTFTLACAVLSSTQTSYASVFQIVNENGSLTAPTVESAGKLYYGDRFSITTAYGDMSVCLEQLIPIMDLRINSNMPFSTVLSPDKRLIDFLFGKNPMRLDENFSRFFYMMTTDKQLDPIMANTTQLEAMEISYDQGVRIFSWFGDEGSGRKFFIKHFCEKRGLNAITINCKKLFVYDYGFVEKALWAVNRECVFTGACCCLNNLDYREDEKEKYIGYMDLAISKLREHAS